MASVVTESFNGIKSHGGSWCEGIGFYTRSAFLKAVAAYPGFAHGGSEVERKREIAAFFAHVTHETGRKLWIPEASKRLFAGCTLFVYIRPPTSLWMHESVCVCMYVRP